jgi:hypothetical protein
MKTLGASARKARIALMLELECFESIFERAMLKINLK